MKGPNRSQSSTKELASRLARKLQRIPEKYRRYPYAVTPIGKEKLAKVLGAHQSSINDRLIGTKEDVALELRKLVCPALETNPPNYRLARWIVSNWGGIDRAKERSQSNEDSFNERIRVAEDWSHSFPLDESKGIKLERIASWSKYLAFRDPERFAIYDARVAYSLNWLLFKCGQRRDFFPFLAGANPLLTALDYRFALALRHPMADSIREDLAREIDRISAVDDAKTKKSRFISRLEKELCLGTKTAYGKYCRLIKEVGHEMYGEDRWGMTRVEMALFAAAPFVAARVVDEFYSLQGK